MNIAIMGAMPEETAGINEYFSRLPMSVHNRISLGNRTYDSYNLNGHTFIVVFSRWGKVAASSTATTLINHFGAQNIIFTGVAGAVSSELDVGDIVIGDNYVQHDMDVSPLPGMEKYEIPLTGVTYFPAATTLLAPAQQAAIHTCAHINTQPQHPIKEFNTNNLKSCIGTLASGDVFITDKAHTATLTREIRNLKTVDMESAAVAQVCYDYTIPFLAVRVVSDKADGSSHVDFPKFIQTISSPTIAVFIQHLSENISMTLPSTPQSPVFGGCSPL